MSRLVVGVVGGVVAVEIPVETGASLAGETAEEGLLYLLQEVEANEDVLLVAECEGVVLGHLPVEGSLVGESLLGQAAVVGVVDVAETAPQLEETALQLAFSVVGEVAEELPQQVFLLVGQIGDVVELVKIAEVGEHFVGIGHVLVDVVEVAQQKLSPSVEMVERLVDAGGLDEHLVQVAHLLDGVGNDQFAMLAKEVADGDVGRAPYRAGGQSRETVVHEERGTLVGEDDGNAAQVVSVLTENVLCDNFEESAVHHASTGII